MVRCGMHPLARNISRQRLFKKPLHLLLFGVFCSVINPSLQKKVAEKKTNLIGPELGEAAAARLCANESHDMIGVALFVRVYLARRSLAMLRYRAVFPLSLNHSQA